MDNQYRHLQQGTTSLILRIAPYAELLYWGARLDDEHLNYQDLFTPAQGQVRVQTYVPTTFCPEYGRGFFNSPGLEGHHQRQDWAPVFKVSEVQQEGRSLTIISEDKIAQLQLTTELTLNHYGVLQLRNRIKNQAATPYTVNRFSLSLPLSDKAKELLSLGGRWLQEFQSQRVSLARGSYSQENRRGRSSHEYFPAIIAGSSHFSESQGEVWGIHLACSGNHKIEYAIRSDGRRFMQVEALYLPGEIVLAQHEELATPWVYAAYSPTGLNHMSHQFHNFVRNEIVSLAKPRPIHLNTWEGIYFDHDPNYIMQMADESAKLGIERFIIDDGWFGQRNDSTSSLGDWFVDQHKYPHGLTPVIEHVKQLGMEFGIWVEPEMVNKNSQLYRAHPDWLLELAGYEQPAGRNQYLLDLTNPEAFNYILSRLRWLLGEHHIDYVKWDMNREIVQPGNQYGAAALQEQIKAVYRLFDTLRAEFPQIELESCASGGGRIDMEILKRCHRFWTSDCNDALERQNIQKGMSYFMPLLVSGAHIGGLASHTTNRKHEISFRGLTALFGHMGVELDPIKTSADEKAGFAHYIALHKKYRQLLHYGDFYRLDLDSPHLNAFGVISQDKQHGLFMISQLQTSEYALNGFARIVGLAADQRYQINIIDYFDIANVKSSIMEKKPHWMENSHAIYSGDSLAKIGLALPIMLAETAMLIEFKQTK